MKTTITYHLAEDAVKSANKSYYGHIYFYPVSIVINTNKLWMN